MSIARTIESAVLSRRELARYLGRSMPSLDRDASAGRLPRAFFLGGAKRWLRSEIDRWLAAGAPPRAEWEAMTARTSKVAAAR